MKKSILTPLAVLTASLAFGQGSLIPPGAPAPTMKTLNQVEPRTPISSVPYTISESGSYYLTTNLTSTTHGVIITTSGVTLDLMGFTLSGDGGFYDDGVFVDGETNRVIEHVVVRNGVVKNFGDGIRAEYSMDGRFEQLAVFGNDHAGVFLYGRSGPCNGNTVSGCSLNANGSYGVYLNGVYGECNGNTIADCTLSANGSSGVYLYGYSGQCNGNTIANCSISENSSVGVYLSAYSGQCNGNTIADCSISENSSVGVDLSGSNGQCNGNTIADCSLSANGDSGIKLYGKYGECDGNTIADCTIQKNSDFGIYLHYATGNRVDGNHVTGQTGSYTYGICCESTAENMIIRNSCVGQTANFILSANDTYGPIVSTAGALSGTDPWANFSR